MPITLSYGIRYTEYGIPYYVDCSWALPSAVPSANHASTFGFAFCATEVPKSPGERARVTNCRVVTVNCPKSRREKKLLIHGAKSGATMSTRSFGRRRSVTSFPNASPNVFTSSASTRASDAFNCSHAGVLHASRADRKSVV